MHFAFSFAPFLLTLEILLTWGVCALALIGIGSLLLRPCAGNHQPLDAFWAGLFLAVLLLQLSHFFVPIGWPFPLLLGALGLVGVFVNGRTFVRAGVPTSANSPEVPRQSTRASMFWSVLIVSVIALRCVGPCNHYDTGFYGAMAVRWINTFPLVPGLANLMAQLGFNSTVFLCVAALNHGPWNGLAFHLFPGMLLSALAFTIVPAFLRVWRGQSYAPADLYLTILAIPAMAWVTTSEIIGTNTDLPLTFVALAAFHYLLAGLQTPREPNRTPHPPVLPLLLASLLFPLALSFKISSVVFASLAWLLAFARIGMIAVPRQQHRNLIRVALFFPAGLLVTWCIRGIIVSGYPFFPSSTLGLPVDWRVPAGWADTQALGVRSWARMPWASSSETANWQWLGAWLSGLAHDRVHFIFPMLLSLAGMVALLKRVQLRTARWLSLLVPSICGLAFWFWRAPAIRFAEPMIWNTAATLGAGALLAALPARGKKTRHAILAGFLAIGMWSSYPRTLWKAHYRPAFEQQQLPFLPQFPLASFRVDGNLSVFVPYRKNQCWDSPLPCSPFFFDSLRLRRGSELRFGFANRDASGDFDKSGEFHKLYWTGPEPDRDTPW